MNDQLKFALAQLKLPQFGDIERMGADDNCKQRVIEALNGMKVVIRLLSKEVDLKK